MNNPHFSIPAVSYGAQVKQSRAATILIHGRGQSPDYMLELAKRLDLPGMAYVALEAAGNTWYPAPFMAEAEANQPALNHSLENLDRAVKALEESGIARSRIALVGFSQGGCLACQYLYLHPERWGAVVAFTGALIGPPATVWNSSASLSGTPVFLGNSDVDPHVPLSRTHETADVFANMGADVQKQVYPGMAHLVNDEEIAIARALLSRCSQ
jgi:phospholipase/carboxylesterase